MKKRQKNPAISENPIVFKESLHVGKPNVGNRARFLSHIDDILKSRWFTNNGRFVQEFEWRIAEKLNVDHCVVVCNATVGLEIVLRALDITGEVIIPSFTFVATAHALQWLGITPVFCDVNPATHNIDPSKVEALITSRTTGIIGVHIWGRPCDVIALDEIARRRGLKLLFDAAHAFGCSHNGRMIGNFGHAEVFSFHATKFVNTFEGGAIVTNDDELAKRVRSMKNFGFDGDVISIGTNGKMSEISAAMGLANLGDMEKLIKTNIRNYHCYEKELKNIHGVTLISYDRNERSNYQYVILEIDQDKTGVTRDQLLKTLHSCNILARRYFHPGCHRMEPYKSLFPYAGLLLPETERLCEKVLCLPTGTSVSENDIQQICEIIRGVLGKSRK
ncbi:MAG: DegT/DnrJ/EryC1/StrS family aminotransferase [Kiritimatiellae bacterium]|nr:DegT/DnrJ/EryC1/StrS family aminotransferase [Kiritimatiellia bacterium]MDD5521888.1 DegT/DnrJ/EryC1/StrS family aminotransferase [Kiritimatiellia bacterium]